DLPKTVSAADLSSGKLVFRPAANANGTPYSSFKFSVQDNGGTANGGVDTSTNEATQTINVRSVNDAPAGVDKTVTTLEDNAYTAYGGVDLDQSPNTLTVNVTSVNDAPSGANKTVTTNEDTAYTFAASDFGFSDATDAPAPNSLAYVKVTSLPLAGTLKNN